MTHRQLEKVSDARDLLELLEYALAGSEASLDAVKFPFGGVRLTVRNISRHLSELERMIREANVEGREPGRTPHARSSESREITPDTGTNGGIASRIQMAPVPRQNRRGYTREIPPEVFSDSHETSNSE